MWFDIWKYEKFIEFCHENNENEKFDFVYSALFELGYTSVKWDGDRNKDYCWLDPNDYNIFVLTWS